MHEKLINTNSNCKRDENYQEAECPKGWEKLNVQTKKKIEVIIDYLNSKRMKEITIKIDGSTIKKGYAVEKDRSFDSNARISDYLKPSAKITLTRTGNGIFGRKELIF